MTALFTGAPGVETPWKSNLESSPFEKSPSAITTSQILDISTTDESLAQRPPEVFRLEDHPVDIPKKIRVAVIGAGISGISAGILLPVKVPGIDLTIFEKNTDVSGTWYENAYPGVRCDIPAHVYQSTFDPNTRWTEEYAQGAEIRDYWQGLARKHGVYQLLKLSHSIEGASWDPPTGLWTLDVHNLQTGEKSQESFNVLISATGRFNAWKLPDYPGIQDFKGHLRHASAWDPSFDPTGKTIAVIGNGASGIQLVPNLQKIVKHLDHYARSKTWIAGSFGGEGAGRRLEPNYYDSKLIASLEDPDVYYRFRKDLESKFYSRFGTVFKSSEDNIALRDEFVSLMSERLKRKPDLVSQILPDFSPNCRRLTPGPGYLEALTEPNVSYIPTPISHFLPNGIVTSDGVERYVDAVICATGANVDMIPQFPITAHGRDLREVWRRGPISYLGLAVPGFPNFLLIQGPNSVGHSGTIPNQIETQITYLARLLRKASSQDIKTFVPSQSATDDFVRYSDTFFAKTVFSENCSSWANGGKPGGRVHGHWPGSASHVNYVKKDPRWEDWEWTYETGNRFSWFGNGWTQKEALGEGDLTPYLKKPGDVDLRTYHEVWFE